MRLLARAMQRMGIDQWTFAGADPENEAQFLAGFRRLLPRAPKPGADPVETEVADPSQWGLTWAELAPVLLTVAKEVAAEDIDQIYAARLERIADDAPATVRIAQHIAARAAEAYLAGTALPSETAYLQAEVAETGEQIAVVAQRLAAGAEPAMRALGRLSGRRKMARAAVQDASSLAQVRQIVSQWRG